MPEPIAYIYRKSDDPKGNINANTLGSLILKDKDEKVMEGDLILYIHQPTSTETQPGVLILMDGEQEMEKRASVKSTPEILDELCKNGEISPQVTVYIPAPEDRVGEYACNNKFSDFLSNKLVPLLQEQFGCSKNRKQTTIGGTSFGGLAATHAALTYPETFGNVLSQSGAFWWNIDWKGFDAPEKWKEATKTSTLETTKQATAMAWLSKIHHKEDLPINFYLSGGTIEESNTPSLNGESFPGAITLNNVLHLKLVERGHKILKTEINSGGHDYESWQADKPTIFPRLLPKSSSLTLRYDSTVKVLKMLPQKPRPVQTEEESKIKEKQVSPRPSHTLSVDKEEHLTKATAKDPLSITPKTPGDM